MIVGYKESPLGIIPITWETKTLGELLEVNTGDKNAQDSILDGEYPFFTRSITTQRIDSFSHDTEALFIAGEGIFKVKHYSGKFDVHQRTYVLTAKDKLNCSLKFFQNQIQSRIIKLVDTSVGSTVQSLRKPIIQELKLVIPPLPEQQKIAEILSTIDNKIEVIDQQITETQALKKGLMQRLLTKGIGHSEFKDSPLGAIPKSWEIVKLGDIAEIVDPQPDHRTPAEVADGIPYIGMGDINNGKINFDNARKVSPEALNKQIRGFEIYPEAFVFGKIGTIGNPTPIPTERFYALSANLILMTSKQLEIAKYLYVIIQSAIIDKQLKHMTNTTSQPALGIKKARELMVPLPKEKEMNQISETMRLIEEKLRILMDKKESYQELKQGLMQQLLTGKIRVKV